MLLVLVGTTNLTKWKKPKQQRGSFSTTAQESEHTRHTKRGRTNTERPFFFAYSPQGKKKTQHPQRHKNKQSRRDKTRGQTKESRHRAKRTKIDARRTKIEANTRKVFYPPNYSRAQKPHKPRKAPKTNKPTQNPQTAPKTALKTQIKAYLQATHQEQSRQRQGTHQKAGASGQFC